LAFSSQLNKEAETDSSGKVRYFNKLKKQFMIDTRKYIHTNRHTFNTFIWI